MPKQKPEEEKEPTIKINASFALFDRARKIRGRWDALAAVMNENAEVTGEQLNLFKGSYKSLRMEMDKWWEDVAKHIKSHNL